MPGSIVHLPRGLRPPFDVFVNGVPQRRGTDFELHGASLYFSRVLAKEGRLGPGRWLMGAFGIGTYRQNDSVDVRYEVNGHPRVAEGLEIEAAPG